MKKTFIAGFIGAGLITAAIWNNNNYYSSEQIYMRKLPLIEKHITPEKRKEIRTTLKEKLRSFDEKGASYEERCKFDKRFTKVIQHKGDEKAAEDALDAEYYDPYAECKQVGQIKKVALSTPGAFGIILSAYAALTTFIFAISYLFRMATYPIRMMREKKMKRVRIPREPQLDEGVISHLSLQEEDEIPYSSDAHLPEMKR